MGRILLPAAFALLILASGCIQQQPPAGSADTALSECISICEAEKANGIDFSSGPCIGNPMQESADTVCDIAHSPRLAVDDLPQNQCSAFREGKATRFVELDQDCALIKRY